MAAGVTADLTTKHFVFQSYYEPTVRDQTIHYWFDGIFGIQTATNPGALFGIGQGLSSWFAGLSVVFLMFIISWMFLFGGLRDRLLTGALGLVSGGILGNLYDRLGWGFQAGYPSEIQYNVRDWIYFRLQGVPGFDPWPNFNLADSCLVVGAAMLFLHAIMHRRA
jgi:signal peptidase II